MANTDMEIVIIRPASQYGPGDLRMLKMFRMLAAGKFVMIGSCQAHFHAVYIDDLVDGFWRAMTQSRHRRRDVPRGRAPLRDSGRIHPNRRRGAGRGAAALASALLARARCGLGLRNPVPTPGDRAPSARRRRVRFFRNNRAFDIDKARRMLGYEPRVDLAQGMRRTVAWYREQGLL
jgi:dihydroflavonol-4-reductase